MTHRIIPFLACAAILFGGFTATSRAAESKIATIHLQRVVDGYHKGKEAGKQLKEAVEAYQVKLKKLEQEFTDKRKVLAQLIQEIESGILSNKKKLEATERAKTLDKELAELDQQRRALIRENEEALAKQDMQAYKAVVGDILKHLKVKLENEKYDFVIKITDDVDNRPYIREGAVVAVGSAAVDITAEVIKEMNAEAPAENPAPAKSKEKTK